MRGLGIAVWGCAVVAVVAGCGGSKPQPLGLSQRVLKTGELAGFVCVRQIPGGTGIRPCRRTLTTLAAIGDTGNAFINDPRAARKRLQLGQAGIVRGFGEDLYDHGPTGPFATSIVVQFKSDKEAKDFLGKLYPESFAPCPEKCQVVKTPFTVSGIKGAKGAQLAQTVGPQEHRFRSFRTEFADGPFVYGLAVGGPLGAVNEDEVVKAAETLYKRVKGRPPPGSGSSGSSY